MDAPTASLLAVDGGLRTGLASFRRDGRLAWCGTRTWGDRARLKRGVYRVLADLPELEWLVVEGDGPLTRPWTREARRRGACVLRVDAPTWRADLLLPREQRSGRDAKHWACVLARRVIEWSGAPRPPTLGHDAAEAVLVGLWGAIRVGWLGAAPAELRRPGRR